MKDGIENVLRNSYKVFGKNGSKVSRLCFGGAAISGEGCGYGFGEISRNDSIELVRHACDLGVNIFDTAPIYGFGESEKRLGEALKEVRENVFIVSKSGVSWHDNRRVNMTNEPKVTEKMLLQSLKDLQSEYIDFYSIHWPDANIDIRRPLEVLESYRERGVIREIGLCNTNIEDLEKSKDVTSVSIVQSEFNFFNTSAMDLAEYLKENQMEFMSWGTLDKGILSGKYKMDRVFDQSDCRKKAPWWKKTDVSKKVELVDKVIQKYGIKKTPFIDLAIAFNLSFPYISTILCGPKNKESLEQIIQSIANIESTAQRFDLKEIANDLSLA
jgi:aryl-alcohol dehydrogenase-like predicted oxidoreductase